MAEEPGEYRRSDIGELYDASHDKRGQWNELPCNRDESGYERDEQRGELDGQRGPKHHDAAGKPNSECGADGDVHGGGDRCASVELPVAEEPGEHRRSDISELYDASHDKRR